MLTGKFARGLVMLKTQKAFDENVKELNKPKRKTAAQKKEEERITFTKTKDVSKFPGDTTSFIFRFEDKRKEPKLNLAWFQRLDHVEDHIKRYSLKKKDYRIIKKV